MKYDTSGDSEAAVGVDSPRHKAVRLLLNAVSYALFAVGIVAFYAFFAPHLGMPQIGVAESLPSIVAPTEGEAVVDVAPAIVGAIAGGMSVYLR